MPWAPGIFIFLREGNSAVGGSEEQRDGHSNVPRDDKYYSYETSVITEEYKKIRCKAE